MSPTRLSLRLLLCARLLCFYECYGQDGGGDGHGYTFSEVIHRLEQGGYHVAYPAVLDDSFPAVPLSHLPDVVSAPFFTEWLAGLAIGYLQEGSNIALYYKSSGSRSPSLYSPLEGFVVDERMQPLEGAVVSLLSSGLVVFTDARGQFHLPVSAFQSTISVNCMGFQPMVRSFSNKLPVRIVLAPAPSGLDAVVVTTYGVTSVRRNLSSIVTVKGDDFGFTPMSNLADALVGRVSGLSIRQLNGVSGSAYSIQLGGRHSIAQNNDVLYVVDGVPLATNGSFYPVGTGSAQGPAGASPLNFISPENIASITVLKDAAATSIYGSRGSNGVVLISLRKASDGPMRLSADVSTGFGRTVKTSRLLSTGEFLALRKEAVRNDGLPVDSATVPEAFYWNGSRAVDGRRLVAGGTAVSQHAGIHVSGGDLHYSYFLSGQQLQESMVFPGNSYDRRGSLYGQFKLQNPDGRFRLDLSGLFSWEGNRLPVEDMSMYQYLAPDVPGFTGAGGKPQWGTPPLSFVNIPAIENNVYLGKVYNLLGQLQATWRLDKGFSLEEHLGLHTTLTAEQSRLPLAGMDPAFSSGGQVMTSNNQYQSTMSETLGRWHGSAGIGRLDVLAGVNYQSKGTIYSSTQMRGFPDDLLLYAAIGADSVVQRRQSVPYRYAAVFGQANYAIRDRYLFSASWRRDGSSQLGEGIPTADFWSVAGGWIFSEEPFLAGSRFLPFGKIRGSFGTTGNEPSAEQSGIVPVSMVGRRFSWEQNYRQELALELGFWQNRLLLSAALCRSWTANQLLPLAGNFPGVLADVRGIRVENKSLEVRLGWRDVSIGSLHWHSDLSLTVPRNRLACWPGFANSVYANDYVLGHSLSVSPTFHWLGVDPQTGLYRFQTHAATGSPSRADLVPDGGFDPSWYLGWYQRLQFGRWDLSLAVDLYRQRGVNPLVLLDYTNVPGGQAWEQLSNGPVEWLDHWRRPGDRSRQQRLTAGGDREAMDRLFAYMQSDAISIDASYLRLREAGLSYRVSAGRAGENMMRQWRLFIDARNLLTYTHFPVTDPETQDPRVLPPIRWLEIGVRFGF